MARTAKVAKPDWGAAREALLEAAAQEFAESGFRGASVSRIAKRTGVTQPLINHHFGSKDGLWRAVLDWVFADMHLAFSDAMNPNLSSRGQLLDVVRQVVFFFARKPQLARIVNAETNHPSDAFEHLFTRYLEPVVLLTQGLLEKAKKDGDIDADLDPMLLHFIVVGAAMQPFAEPEMVRRSFGVEPFTDEYIERYAETLCHVFDRGVGGCD